VCQLVQNRTIVGVRVLVMLIAGEAKAFELLGIHNES
jgi:hypothetical protein